MTEGININSVEHIAEDSVLLINYNVTDPGVWYLYELLSAYRNPDDDYWTVVYPDTSDPRHTNFPITVSSNSMFEGVFVWKYSNSDGIGAGNFNGSIPYYLQLTVYKASPPYLEEEPRPSSEEPSIRIPPSDPIDPPRVRTPVVPPKVPPPDHNGGGGVRGGFPGTPDPIWIPIRRPNPRDPFGGIPVDPFGNAGDPTGQTGDPTGQTGTTGQSGRWYDFPLNGGLISEPEGLADGRSNEEPTQPSARPRPPYSYSYANQPNPPRRYPPESDNPFVLSELPQVYPGDRPLIPGQGIPTVGTEIPGFFEEDPSTQSSPGRPNISIIPGTTIFDPYVPPSLNPQRPIVKPVADVASIVNDPRPQTNIRRLDTTVAGESQRLNSFQVTIGKSVAITSQFSLGESAKSKSKVIDYNSVNSAYGITEGHQVKYNYDIRSNAGLQNNLSSLHFDPSATLNNCVILLEIPVTDVGMGERIYIGSACLPEEQVQINGRLELWATDSQQRNILLKTSEQRIISKASPIEVNTLLGSHNFVLGQVVITACVRDSQGKIAKTISRTLNIRPSSTNTSSQSNERVRESNNYAQSDRLPSAVVDFLNIKHEPITLNIYNNRGMLLLLEKDNPRGENKFGAVLTASSNVPAGSYSLDVYSSIVDTVTLERLNGIEESLYISNIPSIIPIGNDLGTRGFIATSSERLMMDKKPLYPNSHVVGIAPIFCVDSEILVHIRPNSNTFSATTRDLKLYTSSSYRIKSSFVALSKVSEGVYNIGIISPYVNEEVALLVHGKNPENIDENYVLLIANTDTGGAAIFTSVDIDAGDYYSIMIKHYSQFNPTKNIIYKSSI
jgi:hypothetical protein